MPTTIDARALARALSCLLASLAALAAGCGGAAAIRAPVAEPVACQYAVLPTRFCGSSEDETFFRETHPRTVRVCNACLEDGECTERPGGSCVELPGEGCSYSAFVCVYPGEPCAGDRSGCPGACLNREGRAVCAEPATTEAP